MFGSRLGLFVIAGSLLSVCGCQHAAFVYSGVDPGARVAKQDPIVLVLPDNPSIREKNFAVLLRDELARSQFNIVTDSKAATWTLSFAINRESYMSGSTSTGSATGFGSGPIVTAVGTSRTKLSYDTDVIISLRLSRMPDTVGSTPQAVWEGTVRTEDRVFTRLPNATLKSLLDHFGANFNHNSPVDKSYQRAIDEDASK